jgi:hypothetical protein
MTVTWWPFAKPPLHEKSEDDSTEYRKPCYYEDEPTGNQVGFDSLVRLANKLREMCSSRRGGGGRNR